MSETASLLAEIEAYCSRYRISEKTFGHRAAKNWKLVGRLRIGQRITLETAKKIRDQLAIPSEFGRAA